MTPEEIRWLTWGAIHHRPHGAPRWDEPGTAKAIADHCGTWQLDTATAHVLAHARDPKARTPYAIRGTAPSASEPTRGVRYPAKAGSPDECPLHPGEWVNSCRACNGDRLAGDQSQPTRAPHTSTVSEHVARLRALKAGAAE